MSVPVSAPGPDDERVSVNVHVEINGRTVVDDIYTTNSREHAAVSFEDWADKIREAES